MVIDILCKCIQYDNITVLLGQRLNRSKSDCTILMISYVWGYKQELAKPPSRLGIVITSI